MKIEEFNLLMQEVGPLDESINGILAISDGVFSIEFERVTVDVEFDEANRRVMLSAEIGIPPADSALKTYEILMSYALAWRQTGGISVGLNGEGGPLALMVSLFAPDLTPRMLTTVVVNLADRALTWRVMVGAGITDEMKQVASAAVWSETMLRV